MHACVSECVGGGSLHCMNEIVTLLNLTHYFYTWQIVLSIC